MISGKQKIFAFIGALIVIGGVAGFAMSRGNVSENIDSPRIENVPKITLAESKPIRLSIPKIGVNASFVELGLDEKKEIEVPESFTEVGWYKYGPTPGELGPAVIIGHVDSKDGPAVFYTLGKLEKGDQFTIVREDGSEALFEVDVLERYEQSNFPTSNVYGDIEYAGIRLITCSGTYDHAVKRYDKNLVVYGHLVEAQEGTQPI